MVTLSTQPGANNSVSLQGMTYDAVFAASGDAVDVTCSLDSGPVFDLSVVTNSTRVQENGSLLTGEESTLSSNGTGTVNVIESSLVFCRALVDGEVFESRAIIVAGEMCGCGLVWVWSRFWMMSHLWGGLLVEEPTHHCPMFQRLTLGSPQCSNGSHWVPLNVPTAHTGCPLMFQRLTLGCPSMFQRLTLGCPSMFQQLTLGCPRCSSGSHWVPLNVPAAHTGFPSMFQRLTLGCPSMFQRLTLGCPSSFQRLTLGCPSSFQRLTLGCPSMFQRLTLGCPSMFQQLTLGCPSSFQRLTLGCPSMFQQLTLGAPRRSNGSHWVAPLRSNGSHWVAPRCSNGSHWVAPRCSNSSHWVAPLRSNGSHWVAPRRSNGSHWVPLDVPTAHTGFPSWLGDAAGIMILLPLL